MRNLLFLILTIFLPAGAMSQNSQKLPNNTTKKPVVTVNMGQKLARACRKFPKTMGMSLVRCNNIQNDNQYNASLFLLEKGSDKVCDKFIVYLSNVHGKNFSKKLLEVGFNNNEIAIAKNLVDFKSKIPVATMAMSQKLAIACEKYPQTMGRALAMSTNAETTGALKWNIALMEEGDEELCEKLLVWLEDITEEDFADNLIAIGFNAKEVELAKSIVTHAKEIKSK